MMPLVSNEMRLLSGRGLCAPLGAPQTSRLRAFFIGLLLVGQPGRAAGSFEYHREPLVCSWLRKILGLHALQTTLFRGDSPCEIMGCNLPYLWLRYGRSRCCSFRRL